MLFRYFIIFSSTLFLLPLIVANLLVMFVSGGQLYDDLEKLPDNAVALVLGCPPELVSGKDNFYFYSRIDAAARLYHSGKVKTFILSGSRDGVFYDEPKRMMQALIKRGIPVQHFLLDKQGDRTLHSVRRARDVYQVNKLIIVSQPFHNYRAVFLAKNEGLDAVAYNAEDLGWLVGGRVRIREYFARLRAVVDVYFMEI